MALRVLLADESSAIKKVFQLALQDYAAQVKSVHQGGDVSEVAREFQPDIIFTDILLQKRDGYEVSREIKDDPVLGKTPVVLMWSGFLDFDEGKFKKCHADARLEKPFDVESLRKVVQKFVPKTQSQPLSAFLELPHVEFQEEKSATRSFEFSTADMAATKTADMAATKTADVVATKWIELDEVQNPEHLEHLEHPEHQENREGQKGPEGLKIDFDFGNISSLFPDSEENPLKEQAEAQGGEDHGERDEATELQDTSWTMESFDPIEDFAHQRLAELPSEEFAQISLSRLKRVEAAGEPEEMTKTMDLFENDLNDLNDLNDQEPEKAEEPEDVTKAMDLFGSDLNDEVESLFESSETGDEWQMQNLSQFRLDLPEGAESEESQVNYVVPEEKITGTEFLLHSPETKGDAHSMHEDSLAVSEQISAQFDAIKPTPALQVPISTQLSREEIEEIVRQECRQIIESMVEKVVPQIAERLIRGELDRLLREEENEAEL